MLLPRYGLPSPFSNSNEIIHPRNRIGSHFRRTKDPEKDEDFVKGETRERAPEALLLSPRGPIRPIDDEIKANAGLDRDSKSSRNVPQRLRYAFTIGISVLFPFIFFFFLLLNSRARCSVTAAFSIAQISRGNTRDTGDVKLRLGKRSARVFYDTYQFSISNIR